MLRAAGGDPVTGGRAGVENVDRGVLDLFTWRFQVSGEIFSYKTSDHPVSSLYSPLTSLKSACMKLFF